MTFTAREDIDQVAILKDAGWIKATISLTSGQTWQATVTKITPVGQWAMQYLRDDE